MTAQERSGSDGIARSRSPGRQVARHACCEPSRRPKPDETSAALGAGLGNAGAHMGRAADGPRIPTGSLYCALVMSFYTLMGGGDRGGLFLGAAAAPGKLTVLSGKMTVWGTVAHPISNSRMSLPTKISKTVTFANWNQDFSRFYIQHTDHFVEAIRNYDITSRCPTSNLSVGRALGRPSSYLSSHSPTSPRQRSLLRL